MTLTTSKTLILASSSPRRQELIRFLQLPFVVQASDADETTAPGLTPSQIVEELSRRKALAVLSRLKADDSVPEDGVLIGSDTIVVWQGEVLGKPQDEADAFRMLSALQGAEHEVYTGIACIGLTVDNAPNGEAGGTEVSVSRLPGAVYATSADRLTGSCRMTVGHSVTKVGMKPLTDEQIRNYIRTGEPMDKAGAYGIQGLGSTLIQTIDGDYFTVVGLPMYLLSEMLGAHGIRVL
ncbi:Maf family protein [Paenibacillus oleatilyticus]|uniref:Maf family protein n=1 Tax=Paenibacillus oleatilyticus TaxID=2594886 RepID=UPI001C1F7C13|nr:Maf family protein [Paenibacillus oleatilyticus]MBU7318939.1 Maf family protein [Paenibacillus oleatilyticus]